MAFDALDLPDLVSVHAAIVYNRKGRGRLHDQLAARAAIAHEIVVSESLVARLLAENERLACQYRGAMLVIGSLVAEADRELELERFAVGA